MPDRLHKSKGETYQEFKAKRAAYSHAKSLLGREIGPLPAIKDPRRRAKGRNDLGFFLQTYFPLKFSTPFGKYHLELIKALEHCLIHDGKQAVAMPRGTGKTTIVKYAAVWALVYGHRRFLMIFSATQTEARKILSSVKGALAAKGTALAEDFPEVCVPFASLGNSAILARGQLLNGELTDIMTSADELNFPKVGGSRSSGATVRAVGVSGSFRGASTDSPWSNGDRPDFIILDDLQKEELARNPDRVNDLEEKINSAIEGLAESGYELSMVMTCTVLQPGDLADRYLNPEIYPQWHGIRGRMLDSIPENLDLWREFRSIRRDDPAKAHRFYVKNRKAMAEGAEVSWPQKFDPKHYRDALEMAICRWADNERGFWSECQNQPLQPAGAAVQVPAKEIMTRVNGLERRELPEGAVHVTGFVDVHDDLLYYAAVAWDRDLTGYVMDYGTFPEQRRRYFAKGDGGLYTMTQMFHTSANLALKMGIQMFLSDMARWEFRDGSGEVVKPIELIFIDAKYKPETVEAGIAAAHVADKVMPARGHNVKATGRPMAEWERRPDRQFFFHLVKEKIAGRRYRSALTDVNFWKSMLHEKFALEAGMPGSVTFWGKDKTFHRMIAEHCNAEIVQLVSSGEHEVNQWRERPLRPDNHLFDCLVGSLAAASVLVPAEELEMLRKGRFA